MTTGMTPAWSSVASGLCWVMALVLSTSAAFANPFVELETRYGIPIHQNYRLADHVHSSWLQAPISAEAKQIDARLIPQMRVVLDRFLNRYPRDVLKRNLSGIYVAKTLTFYGKRYAGTNSRRQIFVSNDDYPTGYVLEILHAEFSSILMRNHSFPKSDWRAVNAADFRYSEAAVAALDDSDPYARDDELLRAGFLTRYGQSTIENDFNQYAVWLFTKPDELERLASLHPRVQAKRAKALAFYRSID